MFNELRKMMHEQTKNTNKETESGTTRDPK